MYLLALLLVVSSVGVSHAGEELSHLPHLGFQEFLPPISGRDITEPNEAQFIDVSKYFMLYGPIDSLSLMDNQMPIDHFGNTTGTYKNRYWINDTHYEQGGPVFS